MPADNRSITITLKLLDSNQSDTDISEQTDTSKVSSGFDSDKSSKAAAKALAVSFANVVATEVVNWADYFSNRELTLTDDYIGQRNKNIALTQINRGIGAISTIGSFAALGAAGGAAGIAIGALVGTAVAVAGIARSDIQGWDQQNIQIRQMEAQLGYTRARAGWSTQAASIGEDL